MTLRGDLSSIKGLRTKLRTLPVSVAHAVAQRAAPDLTRQSLEALAAGRTVYGEARPAGVDGDRLSLERTGATRETLKFTSIGTVIRCVLGTPYAKFLIGKYGILPNGALPVAWSRRLGEIVQQTAAAEVRR
jgi:hypothetical protein